MIEAATTDPSTLSGHVVVCGLNQLSLGVIAQLRSADAAVAVVDDDPAPRLVAVLARWDVPFVNGSPRYPFPLRAAGLERAAAAVCIDGQDLRSLEATLAVRDLCPDIRVVCQMGNAAVRRALLGVTGRGTVLDVAELAGPGIVQACVGGTSQELSIRDETFVACTTTATSAGTLRQLYGDLVPLHVSSGDEATVCPGRDLAVSPGDHVTVVGTPGELTAAGLQADPDPTPSRGLDARLGLRSVLQSVRNTFDSRLRLVLAAIVVLVAAASVVVRLAYRLPGGGHLGDIASVYFMVETVATVGFGDFSFASQGPGLQIFGIVVIILGVALVSTLFALVTNVFVNRSLAETLGQTRISQLEGHVVVVGLGAIGMRVVRGLVERHVPVVVVDRDEDNRHLSEARALGVAVHAADATLLETLDAVGAGQASAVAVLTSDDLTNLEAALSIRDYLGGAACRAPIVMRIFDRSLSRTVERNFGFHDVRSTSTLAATWFVGAALGLSILSTFYVARQLFVVAGLTVAETGGLAGLRMEQLSARIRVVAISRAPDHDGLEHPPRRTTRFNPGDRAYLVGPPDELLVVLRRDAAGADQTAS